MDKLNWAVIGTGGIAGDFAQALESSERLQVVNATGSSPEKGRAFADKFQIPRSSATLSELLKDDSVQAVYIATPHPLHPEQAIACIEAGKAVLCEKPIAVNAADAERVIAAARAKRVFLQEAYMYRCHPLLKELIARLKAGVIGTLRHVRADFAFRVPRDPKGRLFNPELGGGGILDVGGYPGSFARLIAGLVEGKPVAEPTSLKAVGVIGPTGVDEFATALLQFSSGLSAQIACGVHHHAGTQAVIFGEDGKIVLGDPWIPQSDRQGLRSSFSVELYDKKPEEVVIETKMPTYAIEAELVADTLPNIEPSWPAMSWDDTLGNMRLLDAWRAAL
jgi:predicted dehydrogenase